MLFKYKLLTIEHDGSDSHIKYGIISAETPSEAMEIIEMKICKANERYYSTSLIALSVSNFTEITEDIYTYL